MRPVLRCGFFFLALAALGGPRGAHADVLLLKDGRILDRPGMQRVEGGVKVPFENGEVLIPADQIVEAVLEKEPPPEPKTDEEREKVAQGYVLFEGKWMKPDRRADLIGKRVAERRAAVAEIREHRLWRNRYKDETSHFEFEYTVAPHVYEYFRDVMEAYYKEFAKTWKIRQPKDLGKLKVCFYTDLESFHQTGGVGGGVQGYFRFVKPLELNFFFERLDPSHTEQVMYHEANHYLQLLLNPDFSMPHFPGESIAEYYGASSYDPQTKKFETGLVLEGRLTEIKNDVLADQMMGLEKLVRSPRGTYEHYNWGWSLVHFLMNDKSYGKKFEKFVKSLVDGKGVRQSRDGPNGMATVAPDDVWEHFRKTLGLKDDEDVKALEAAWHDYVRNGLQFVTASGLEKAATSAMRTGQPIKAKRLFSEALEKGSENPLTYWRYADLLSQDGKSDEAIEYYRKAIEKGPLEGRFYADLGRALRRKGKDEEGLRLLKLALELDPDNAWLESEVEMMLEDAKEEAAGG